jgi:hypothetical protein
VAGNNSTEKFNTLSPDQEAALDAPLPDFPESAWRGMFGEWRKLMASDPGDPLTPVSECPEPFHFANFLAVAAAELGARSTLPEGFPNFFIFVCGRTGTKKSTASDFVEEFIVKNFPEPADHFNLTSMSSGEGLVRVLVHNPNLLIRYDEVKDLFATTSRQGSRLESMLNSAFNLRSIQRNIGNSDESKDARNYYLNLLLNGTLEHVLLDCGESLFKGGMLNRFLVFAAKPTNIVKPQMGEPDHAGAAALAAKLFNHCKTWRTVFPERGKVRLRYSKEARLLHEEWYTKHSLETRNMSDLAASPLARLDLFSKKLAMMYTMLESEPIKHPIIAPAQMEAALAVISYCEDCMKWMTDGWAGQRTLAGQAEALAERRIEAFLQSKGCITERELYRRLHLSFAECAKAVNALVALGAVRVYGERPRMIHYLKLCTCDL